jgi:uncharacterized hydrophobic protein (TIGR00271 family)
MGRAARQTMLELHVHTSAEAAATIVESLVRRPGVHNLVTVSGPGGGTTSIVAEIEPAAADALLVALGAQGLSPDLIHLVRHRTIPWLESRAEAVDEAIIWADLVAEARLVSRLAPRYLALMAVAGVLAGLSIIEANVVLLVGAMATSPDLAPIVGTSVGLVGRRPRMFRRSLGSLAAGLAVGAGAAFLVTVFLGFVGRLRSVPEGVPSFVGSLLTLDIVTIIVAFVAGIAAMLAFETRGSAAVGVAISVTTIPAAAFLGVTTAASGFADAGRALAVLAVNVLFLIIGGSSTLLLQRMLDRPLLDSSPGSRP